MAQWSAKKKVWLFSLVLSAIPILLGFLQYAIIGLTSLLPSWDYIPLGRFFLFFVILEAVIGYFMGDALVAEYRHRSKNFEGKLPESILQTRFIRRTPFWIAAGVHAIACVIAAIWMAF